MLTKCILLVLCGAGIGSSVTWLIMRNRRPITEVQARQKAEAYYCRLMGIEP